MTTTDGIFSAAMESVRERGTERSNPASIVAALFRAVRQRQAQDDAEVLTASTQALRALSDTPCAQCGRPVGLAGVTTTGAGFALTHYCSRRCYDSRRKAA